ncbi:MAG: hypothetical protein WC712_06025 [Candidatus Brocadiia bacterium]
MIIFWTGKGFFVPVIGFLALMMTKSVSSSVSGNERYYAENGWVILIGMLCAAAVTYWLHTFLSKRSEETVVDAETGEKTTVKLSHSFMVIPVKWWPVVFIAIGVIFLFAL